MKTNAVIMAGGIGSRLWPLSQSVCPKQFIKLADSYSLFQQTALRCRELDKITVVTTVSYLSLVTEQLKELRITANIITEPVAKGTAPCAILAALHMELDEVMVLLPSDHRIDMEDIYRKQILKSCKMAQQNSQSVIMLGVKPTSPHTGFGYIKMGEEQSSGAYKISAFAEKPSLELAKQYYNSSEYFWNSGIFTSSPAAILELAKNHTPEMLDLVKEAFESSCKDDDKAKELYKQIIPNSIDKAFIECAPSRVLFLEAEFPWQDMGSWAAIWEAADKDQNKNFLAGNVITNKVESSYVFSEDKLTAVIGLENVIVVNTKGATLVSSYQNSEQLQEIAGEINNKLGSNNQIAIFHNSWGSYELVAQNENYNVINLTIKPGRSMSREDGYTVFSSLVMISGRAEIIVDNRKKVLKKNDSVVIAENEDYVICNSTKTEISLVAISLA